MNEQRLREALRSAPIEDPGARTRALAVVRAAYREREPARERRRWLPAPARYRTRGAVRPPWRRWLPALAVLGCVLAAAVVGASLGSPGDAVARWVREVLGVGSPHARPALVRVPGGGRLLVAAGDSVWAVAPDGARRRLGDYDGASWSPHGRFAVAWRDGELFAVEPGGRVRWSLARRGRITAARWAPVDGFRIAYLSGRAVRIVNGDGTGDRALARASVGVRPAWRPDAAHVLAYAGSRARVRVIAVDSGQERWRARVPDVVELAWSPDGRRLAAATPRAVVVFARGGRRLGQRVMPRGTVVDDVTWSPGGRLTIVRRGAASSEITVGARTLLTGPGRFGRVAWSPDGRRLLVPWPAADQWLFLDAGGGRVAAIANIARQFARGPERSRPFPDTVEWCCR